MKYIKELDSIRGIGIIGVLLFHWLPIDAWYNTFPNRPFGVDVFFVLSGFLITQILLRARLAAEDTGVERRSVFIHFYFNRALRILPLYFIVIALILLLHEWLGANVNGEIAPAATFTLNFHFYQNQYWGDLTTHLWTLSVEEQFYLLWPWVILLVRKKHLLPAIACFIIIGIFSQLLINDQEFGYLPTQTCFDAFGIGAGLAWFTIFRPNSMARLYIVLRLTGVASLIILIFAAAFPDVFFLTVQRTLRSLVAVWAIAYVVLRVQRNAGAHVPLFGNSTLQFIGKISYGMYMYHIFLPWMYHYINAPLNEHLPVFLHPYLLMITLIENIMQLILISWLSYRWIERPVLRLKTLGFLKRPRMHMSSASVSR